MYHQFFTAVLSKKHPNSNFLIFKLKILSDTFWSVLFGSPRSSGTLPNSMQYISSYVIWIQASER